MEGLGLRALRAKISGLRGASPKGGRGEGSCARPSLLRHSACFSYDFFKVEGFRGLGGFGFRELSFRFWGKPRDFSTGVERV